ncbi:c2h2 type zinc finger containing [Fusarium longipes]|uniref:C2h2 type zinc finger containing n=1 Tax=Fusarium longipes TaxID=694270 RepID=A0A395SAW7_9HYPO|nr:c2h2 type zinc finger containing [Fusarium longipes]
MASRWFTLLLLLTPVLAMPEETQEAENPYYSDGIDVCIAETMGICYIKPEDDIVPCLCGQDPADEEKEFLNKFAQCVGRELPNEIERSYKALAYDCKEYFVRLNMTKDEFTEAAEKGSDTGLSTGATAGIAVGAVLGGAVIIGALVWFWLQNRKKKGSKLQSNPSSPSDNESPPNWEPEFKPEWTANSPVELPPTATVPIYEMDPTPTVATEMPASAPHGAEHRGTRQ